MDHAWLDSLSEDWVSQPNSPFASKPGTMNNALQFKPRTSGSKIPRPSSGHSAQTRISGIPNRNTSVLSERSRSDVNVSSPPKRTPSKLSLEFKPSAYGRPASRSVSNSTSGGSVVHHSVRHKRHSSSPGKDTGDTPEWKRRLLHGNLAYGEQRDLFTSAGGGLQDMFKPPAPGSASPKNQTEADNSRRNDTTMPSSPPAFATGRPQGNSSFDIHSDRSVEERLPENAQPSQGRGRAVRYRMNEDESDASDQSSEFPSEHDSSHQGIGGQDAPAQDDSRLSAPVNHGPARKISNQSAARHEEFSPIFIAKHSGEDGQIKFAPMEFPSAELQQRLEKLQKDQMLRDARDDSAALNHRDKPINIENTEDFERIGSFVNFRRGGRSADDSFRQRGLSSALPDVTSSSMLPDHSLQASTPKRFPSMQIHEPEDDGQGFQLASPPQPPVPYPSPQKNGAQAQDNPGSPLKLFGAYDTFTNQTLLRRISQFEDANTSPSSSRPSHGGDKLEDVSRFKDNASFTASSKPRTVQQDKDNRNASSGSVSRFGAGELDDYEFREEFSRMSLGQDSDGGFVQHQRPFFSKPRDRSPQGNDHLFVEKRRQRSGTTPLSHSRNSSFAHSYGENPMDGSRLVSGSGKSVATPTNPYFALESKRPRTSPTKDPTPKRRRTLHESDIAYGVEEQGLDSIRFSHQQMQVVISRKRKDARPGDSKQQANSEKLASRSILRPRTPTPSQTSSLQREHNPSAESPAQADENPNESRKHFQPTPHPRLQKIDGGRKASLKTDDFLDEAHKVMEKIRLKGGLQSGLASLEESEEERERQHADGAMTEESFQESTREPFSRPPSREGRPIPRRAARQDDPEVVSYLKKYEEHSDMGDIIASSLRNLGVSKDDIAAAKATQQHFQDAMAEKSTRSILEDDDVLSDPPNIKISHNPHRRHDQGVRPEGGRDISDPFRSHSSGSESGYSTGRSNHTASSRGSDTRKTIAPQTVSHLIPDQVGNMVLDRQRNIWVKNKKRATPRRTKRSRSNTLLSEGSEDDPFADIPDLTVDVTKEIQNLKPAMASPTKSAQGNSLKSILVKDSGAGSVKKASATRSSSNIMKKFAEADDESVEHEITIREDRFDSSSPRRRMTIAFSSPIASIIHDVVTGSSDGQDGDSSMFAHSVVEKPPTLRQSGRRTVSIQSIRENGKPRPRSASGVPSKRHSVRGEAFVPRPISRIDERDERSEATFMEKSQASEQEVSTAGDRSVVEEAPQKPKANANVLFSTPARPRAQPRPENAQLVGQYVGCMSLSPLSDFSAHKNKSLGFEVSYVLGDQNLVTGDGSKRVMSQGVRDLVDKIAQVEPFEPYWEDMKNMDLQNKRIDSLHMLDQFCGNIVTLDASHNAIRNLDGIPSCVRDFKISHNLLSEMTSWDRLANLQYLNVSNNNIKNLSHFRELVHLRVLIADNAKLVSLDGVKFHDALQTLRARGNLIEDIDLDDTDMQKLMILDLENNKITKVENVHQLSSLTTLNLKGNRLEKFNPQETLKNLKSLNISGNRLKKLNVERMPHLHQLYADRNNLRTINGLSRVPRLDSLSLREQEGSKPLGMSFLEEVYEVRKLFLSGNCLGSFTPTRDFLNLQLLDLANCGLQSLPGDFGEMMPNLRVLNLNFNGLSDIDCLLYIPRLKRLYLAGNRLEDIRIMIPTLTQFPWLTEIDLRDNPVTQGFYAPVQVLVQKDDAQTLDPFKLPDADPERDAKFCSRLDMDTRILRRVYERKFVRMCKQLRKLDGLHINRQIRNVKDAVFKAMVKRGILLRYDGQQIDLSTLIEDETSQENKEKGEEEQKANESSRWGAEDSFA